MNATPFFVAALATLSISCNAERKSECDRLLTALKPLEQEPGADAVEGARRAIEAIQFQDEPLREYASSAKSTLTVLAEKLRTQAGDSAPDGTDDVVKEKRKEARGEVKEVIRYCTP